MSPTITVSTALKDELERVRDTHDHYSLDETVNHVIRNPRPGNRRLDGYERKLSEPVRVSHTTKEHLRSLRDRGNFSDFEAVLRDCRGVVPRDTGTEEPVSLDPITS